MLRYPLVVSLTGIVLVATPISCSDSASNGATTPEAASDGSVDSASDGWTEAAADSATDSDAGSDSSSDTGSETDTGGVDATVDVALDSASDSGTDSAQQQNLELAGTWDYVGKDTEYRAVLAFEGVSMTETVFVDDATTVSGTYQIAVYDAELNHMKAVLSKTEGSYPFAVGYSLYCTYVLKNDTMDLYYSPSSYPSGIGGEEGKDYWTFRRRP